MAIERARTGTDDRGLFIVLVGPDGVGKSTLARHLLEGLQHARYFHFAPPLRKSALQNSVDPSSGSGKITRGESGTFFGIARLLRSFARFWVGYVASVRPAVRRGTLVVADRWAYSYLIQPSAVRYGGPRWLARLALSALPHPDAVVNLRASPEVIRQRKQELSFAEIEAELAAYSRLPVERLLTFDAEEPPDLLYRAVCEKLGLDGDASGGK